MELAVEQLVRAIAGHELGSRLKLPTAPVPSELFFALLSHVGHHRLVGAMAETVVSGAFPVSSEQYDLVCERHTDWARQALMVDRVLLRVGECLLQAGIDFRTLKGSALCRLVYDDPSWRVYSDVDVLLRSEDFDRAVSTVRDRLGGAQAIPELRQGFDHEFGKEAVIAVDGIEVDLHRTFVAGPFGLTIELSELFRSAARFDLAGKSLPALDANSMVLHAAYNLAVGDYPTRLSSVRDLLRCVETLSVDPRMIAAIAQDWRGTAVVQRAAQIAIETVDLAPGSWFEDLAKLSVPRRESVLLQSYLTEKRSYTRSLASLAVIPGIAPRLRYARALMAPSADYLHSRGWTERVHILRAGKRLFRRD